MIGPAEVLPEAKREGHEEIEMSQNNPGVFLPRMDGMSFVKEALRSWRVLDFEKEKDSQSTGSLSLPFSEASFVYRRA